VHPWQSHKAPCKIEVQSTKIFLFVILVALSTDRQVCGKDKFVSQIHSGQAQQKVVGFVKAVEL